MKRSLLALFALLALVISAQSQMTSGGSGRPDLYAGTYDAANPGYRDISGKTTATPPAGAKWYIVLGQSLEGNHNDALNTPSHPDNCFNLNPYTGIIYKLADPVLGATGTFGSYLPALCDALIGAGKGTNIVLVPGAIGGSTVGQWTSAGQWGVFNTGAPGGWFSQRPTALYKRVREKGFNPDGILWGQGAQDGFIGTSQADWQARMLDVIATTAASGYSGPWYIAKSSMTSGGTTYAAIQAAQDALPNGTTIKQGPNIDGVTGGTNRQSDGHLTTAGAAVVGAMWEPKIP